MRALEGFDVDHTLTAVAGRRHRAVSRRAVLHAGGVVGGAAVVAAGLGPGADAAKRLRPVPIPGGTEVAGELFHLYLPAPGSDISTITDFVGDAGVAMIDGRWEVIEGHPEDGARRGHYEVDLRFMKGLFRGADKEFHQATFGFV
jgi:hypothetical protein